ncbi:MAG: C25 family cysteine peptidase [bacterium]
MKRLGLLVFLLIGEQGFCFKSQSVFDGERIRFSVEFSPLEIKQEGTYSLVSSAECDDSFTQDRPRLPIKSIFLLIPPNSSVRNIKIIPEKVQIKGEYVIPEVSPPIPISQDPQSAIRDPQFFMGVFPEEVAEVSNIQHFKGYSILPLILYPAQYDSKALYWNKKIEIEIEIEKPKIASTPSFYREDEETIKGLVANPDLLSSYKRIQNSEFRIQNYQYVVITDESLATSFQPLIDSKIQKGLTATITTTSWIYANYTGRDNQEKIRNFIKDYYTYYSTEYILLGGDVEVVPYRGVYAKVDKYTESNMPCDLYFSCLDGDWDGDKDNIFGELTDEVDLMPEVYVGRAPVNTGTETEGFVNKVISYIGSPTSSHLLDLLLIAYEADATSDCKVIKEEIASFIPIYFQVEKEYESEGGVSMDRVIAQIEDGVGIINHDGHANYQVIPPFGSSVTDGRPIVSS